jgi:hypothetical protein
MSERLFDEVGLVFYNGERAFDHVEAILKTDKKGKRMKRLTN